MLLFAIQVSANPTSAQSASDESQILDRRISLTVIDKPLSETLEKIENTANLTFAYNPEILPVKRSTTLIIIEKPLKHVLDKVLKDKTLKYKVVNKQIVIFRPAEPSANETKAELEHITIKGVVKDKLSGEAIPFAHITVDGHDIGTVSNNEGEFTFTIPPEYRNKNFLVKYIGYKTYITPIEKIDTLLKISLEESVTQLKSITAKPIEPKDIIRDAVAKIPVNYGLQPVMLTAFFRESVSKDEELVSLSEAVLEIYKAPYHKKEKDRIKLIKGRKSPDVKPIKEVGVKVQGGPYNIVNLDVVKSRISFLHRAYFKYYNYKFADIVSIDGRRTYVIKFDQKDKLKASLFKGEMYIDVESLAFIYLEFELSKKGIKYAKKHLIEDAPKDVTTMPLKASYKVEYVQTDNGKWQLSRINGFNYIIVISAKHDTHNYFTTESVLTITKRNDKNIQKISKQEAFRPNQFLVEQLTKFKDTYWENNNFVTPDEKVKSELKNEKTKKTNDKTSKEPEEQKKEDK